MKKLLAGLFSLLPFISLAADVNETNIPVATYLAPTDYVRVLTNGAGGLANSKTRIAPISLLPSGGGSQVWTNDLTNVYLSFQFPSHADGSVIITNKATTNISTTPKVIESHLNNASITNIPNSVVIHAENRIPGQRDGLLYLSDGAWGGLFESGLGFTDPEFGIAYDNSNGDTGGTLGIVGVGRGISGLNVGIEGVSAPIRTNRIGIAVVGCAVPASITKGTNIAGYFEIYSDFYQEPTWTSAVLLCDSRDTGYPLFIGRTNGNSIRASLGSSGVWTNNGNVYPSNSVAFIPTAAALGTGGFWTGNSNGFLVTVYSLDGSTTVMKILAP